MDQSDIYRAAARELISHRENAELHAASQANELQHRGDIDGATEWRRILTAIYLLRETDENWPHH